MPPRLVVNAEPGWRIQRALALEIPGIARTFSRAERYQAGRKVQLCTTTGVRSRSGKSPAKVI